MCLGHCPVDSTDVIVIVSGLLNLRCSCKYNRVNCAMLVFRNENAPTNYYLVEWRQHSTEARSTAEAVAMALDILSDCSLSEAGSALRRVVKEASDLHMQFIPREDDRK